MIIVYELMMGTLFLAALLGLLWLLVNVIRYVAVKMTGGKATGIFALSDKWINSDKKGEKK